jgi:hypothetical protein
MGQYNLIELNGMARGRFIYSLGVNSGSNLDTRTTQNATAHLGFKVGGMRLDGEGDSTGNPQKPWAETAFTFDLFGYRSASHFTNGNIADPTMPADMDDLTYVLGGHARFTAGSFELDSGLFQEWHSHVLIAGTGVKALSQYDELSYVVFPWLIPAVRMEYVGLLPDGGMRVSDYRFLVGAACLIRPNLKVTLTGYIEQANAAPDAGWAVDDGGRFARPTTGSVTEFEGIQVGFSYAY